MAKKKDKVNDGSDGGAERPEGAEPVVPVRLRKADDKGKAEHPDAAHMSMTDLLMEGGGEFKGSVAEEMLRNEDPGLRHRGHVNLVLLLLVVGVVGGAGFYLGKIASHEERQKRIEERLEKERAHREEQIAKMKRYGNLRIETNPPGATVAKDGEKIMIKDEATGQMIPGLTPMTVNNLDIALTYKFEIQKDGYEAFQFSVAEHVWTKDQGNDDYAMRRDVDLVPNACEYWFLYDGGLKKEMRFPDQAACGAHHDGAAKKGSAVTECTCKMGAIPAPGTASAPAPGAAPSVADKK